MSKHYIYRIINLENGKYYVGRHACGRACKVKCSYMGSGCFKKDAKLHPEKYVKVIICYAESYEESIELEKLFVTQELVDDPMCYNMNLGGHGGWGHAHTKKVSEETRKKMSESRKKFIKDNPEHLASMSQKMRGRKLPPMKDTQRKNLSLAKTGKPGPKHSDETKALMALKRKQYWERKRAHSQSTPQPSMSLSSSSISESEE